MQSVEWPSGKNYAYVVCASIDEARGALAAMRGAPLGGQDRRLRIDFADMSHIGMNFDLPRNGRGAGRDADVTSAGRRDHDSATEHRSDDSRHRHEDDRLHLASSADRTDHRTTNASDSAVLDAASIGELAGQLPIVWTGRLMLKNSAFAIKLHLVEGDTRLVDSLLRDPTTPERTPLKITQRLRMDESKISEVRRRVTLAGPTGYCIMLALSLIHI